MNTQRFKASPLEDPDERFMQAALDEAAAGLFSTTPNPRVGCVFVNNGHIIARGHHIQAGGPHAEVHAMEQARQAGIDLAGSTAYVTLEPCSHHGRTGPCAEALIPTGVKRVVVAITDPNPLVAGRGLAMLEAAGIETRVGVLAEQARWLNRGFLSRMERQRPWVRLKVASSADGITALPNGVSQWITGPQARQDGHRLRAQACAVLTGIGTVKADDPLLNVRGIDTPRQPIKVVVDSGLDISPDAKLLREGQVWIAHCQHTLPDWHAKHPNRAQIDFIQAAHSTESAHHSPEINAKGKTDLRLLLNELAKRGVNELHLEAGFGLNGSFMQADLVDEVVHYQAPLFLGQGAGLFRLPPLSALPEQTAWALRGMDILDPDLKITWIRQR